MALDHGAALVPVSRLLRSAPPPSTLRDEPRWSLAVRAAKRLALSANRLAGWALRPSEFGAPTLASDLRELPLVVVTERLAITGNNPHAHPVFERGKVHNLRLAVPAFDGLALEARRPFSFWRTLGRLSPERGFVAGMELRGGCVVPAIGGGICLLSNGLFRLALRANFEILERHGHSLEALPPGPDECWGADATVAWADIDLRFAPRRSDPARFALGARIVDDVLVLALHSDRPLRHAVELRSTEPHLERRHDRTTRSATLVRIATELGTGIVTQDRIATDRKRVLSSDELGRSCLTCEETACQAREAQLALVPAHRR